MITKHFVPYSNLPNTRPRISSPLTTELTSADHPSQPTIPSSQAHHYSTKALTLFCLLDALLFVRLASAVSPYLQRHLLQLSHQLQPLESPFPSELIIPTLALVKSLSSVCLLNTGSTIFSYSIRSLFLYTLLALTLYLSNQYPSVLSLSILFCALSLLIASLLVCLPLLRLTQVLLDLEDQEALQSNPINPLKPNPSIRKTYSKQSIKLLPQARRYQHLMNPF